MANEVRVKVILDDDGTMRLTEKSAKKLGLQLDDLGKNTVKVDRGLKGVAQAGANGTKNFSKMAGTLNGVLVPAYATVAATVFAATAVFNNFQRAAQTDNLAKGLDALGASSGRNLSKLAKDLRDATQGAISLEQSLRSTALASAGGVSGEEFVRLGRVARNASVALGRDLTDSLDRLTRGVTKLEPEILDELGIIVRVDEASQKYAASIGKSASQLTNLQKRQAFLNETLAQGEQKFDAIGEIIPVDGFTKLSATIQDATKTFTSFVNVLAEPLAAVFADLPGILLAFGATFASVVLKTVVPALGNIAEESANAAKKASNNFKDLEEEQEKIFGKKNKKRFKELEDVLQSQNKQLSKGLEAAKKTKDLDQARLSVYDSLVSRQKILVDGKVAGRNITAQGRKDLELTIAVQERLLTQLDQEIIKRDRLAVLSGRALAQANAASATATIITGLDDPTIAKGEKLRNTIDGLKKIGNDTFNTLTESTQKTRKGLTTANLAAIQLRTSFTVLSASGKVLGSVFLRLLPYVGPILLAIQILAPVVKKVAEATKLWSSEASKLNDEIEEQIENSRKQEKAASDQIKVQQKIIESLKKEEQTLENLIRIKAVESEINKIQTANNLAQAESLAVLQAKAKEYEESAKFVQKAWDFVTGGSAAQDAVGEGIIDQVARAGDESALKFIESIRNQFKQNNIKLDGLLGAEELLSSVKGAQDLADKSEEILSLTKLLRNEGGYIGAINAAKAVAGLTGETEEQIKSLKLLKSIQQSVLSDSRDIQTAFQNLKASSALSTEYDELNSSLESLINGFNDFNKLEPNDKSVKNLSGLLTDVRNSAPDLADKIGLTEKALLDAIEKGIPSLLELVDKTGEYGEKIKKAREYALGLKNTLDLISNVQKELSNISKSSVNGFKISQALSEKELETQIKLKEQKRLILEKTGEPLLEIEREIFNLSLKQSNESIKSLEARKKGLELRKQELAIDQKILQANIQRAQAEQRLLESRAKLDQLKETGNTELDSKRQLEIAIKSAELALDTARKQNELKLKQITAETDLQKIQFSILDAETKLLSGKLKLEGERKNSIKAGSGDDLLALSTELEGISFQSQLDQLNNLAEAQRSAANSVLEAAETQIEVSIREAFRGAFENNEIYQTFASNLQSNLSAFFKGETSIGEAIGGAIISTLEKQAENLLADAFRLFENATVETQVQQVLADNTKELSGKIDNLNTTLKGAGTEQPSLLKGPKDSTVQVKDVADSVTSQGVAGADLLSGPPPGSDLNYEGTRTGIFGGTRGALSQLFRPVETKTTIEGDGMISEAVGKDGFFKRIGNVFGAFTDDIGGLFSKEGGFLSGLGDIFKGGLDGFGSIFKSLGSALFGDGEGGGLLGSLAKGAMSLFGFGGVEAAAMGGIYQGGISAFANGGIVTRPTMGLVGEAGQNEAVVPLPDGKAIPVNMNGANNNNNVAVNINMATGQAETTGNDQQLAAFGNSIVDIVQREIADQTRPGGLLAR